MTTSIGSQFAIQQHGQVGGHHRLAASALGRDHGDDLSQGPRWRRGNRRRCRPALTPTLSNKASASMAFSVERGASMTSLSPARRADLRSGAVSDSETSTTGSPESMSMRGPTIRSAASLAWLGPSTSRSTTSVSTWLLGFLEGPHGGGFPVERALRLVQKRLVVVKDYNGEAFAFFCQWSQPPKPSKISRSLRPGNSVVRTPKSGYRLSKMTPSVRAAT